MKRFRFEDAELTNPPDATNNTTPTTPPNNSSSTNGTTFVCIRNYTLETDDVAITTPFLEFMARNSKFLAILEDLCVLRTWGDKVLVIVTRSFALAEALILAWGEYTKFGRGVGIENKAELATPQDITLLRMQNTPFCHRYAFARSRLMQWFPKKGSSLPMADFMVKASWTQKDESEWGPLEEFLTFVASGYVDVVFDEASQTVVLVG
eukprot:PhF_6_TR2551/c0_g1_i2/m.4330